ncbi:MAG: methylcobalamin:coenzyme M methyltransferase [candidate division BRC1 bacterium ADurb.BinA364]|nr:MAG: methylcobalamin:coenzyme M methyltransferase [candidate division BRC1 bacterium ADurb.BinA364]
MPAAEMTGRERVQTILRRQIPDRIGLDESFWGDTVPSWIDQGYPKGVAPWKHFNLDIVRAAMGSHAAFHGRSQLIEETEEWRIVKDGNGATMRSWKNRTGVPEHLGFDIVNGDVWRRQYREATRAFDPKRLNLDAMREARQAAAENDKFFCFTGVEVFEIGKNYAGHEHMCIGMAEDPDWIHDMFDSFIEMQIQNFAFAFEKIGLPDGIWLFGDIGFKNRPFISLAMYRELVLPHNKRLIDFFKSKGLPVIFHSCGFIEPLVPGFIETGIDMLQAMEVKAGCDLRRLKPLYGDKIGFMGNVDIRALETNDLEKVEEEVRAKVLCGKEGGGYVFHTDHSVPSSVRYATYRFALQKALEYGRYDR